MDVPGPTPPLCPCSENWVFGLKSQVKERLEALGKQSRYHSFRPSSFALYAVCNVEPFHRRACDSSNLPCYEPRSTACRVCAFKFLCFTWPRKLEDLVTHPITGRTGGLGAKVLVLPRHLPSAFSASPSYLNRNPGLIAFLSASLRPVASGRHSRTRSLLGSPALSASSSSAFSSLTPRPTSTLRIYTLCILCAFEPFPASIYRVERHPNHPPRGIFFISVPLFIFLLFSYILAASSSLRWTALDARPPRLVAEHQAGRRRLFLYYQMLGL